MQKIIAAAIMIAALAVAGTAGAAGELYTGPPVDTISPGDSVFLGGVEYRVDSIGAVLLHSLYPDPCPITYLSPEEPGGVCGIIVEMAAGPVLYVSDTYRYTTLAVSPTAPPEPEAPTDPCAEATTDLERGTCNGRETMTSEARTGIIVGLEIY